jgi:hypothetical protein
MYNTGTTFIDPVESNATSRTILSWEAGLPLVALVALVF